ncbi:restriction endonuclease subunit S [Bifidobacterium adolescentis]|uniref:restriction endonuclease subunit S n=1 Tax=Bifidobacterium adolescentis TaxID=1680 RepID=UPI001E33B444|nr:restriction endonuclease subunit S [Bifidobacterium adolescentis]MDB1503061.1 restriction endonuclease subunit S [Bifidobacterium adolescentis]
MTKTDTSEWKEFSIGDLFEISRPAARSQTQYAEGDVPFVASGNFNNGVTKWCKPKSDELPDGGIVLPLVRLMDLRFIRKKIFWDEGAQARRF